MAVAYLAPALRLKSWLNNGQPNSGGTVQTLAAGTSIPVGTWTDSTATQPNLNPILLNQRGEASVFLLPNVAYKFIEFDQGGNEIGSTDQVVNSILVTYYGVDTGFANNYIVTAATPYTTYQNGELVFFVPAATNTGPSTININNLGPIPITTITGNPLTAGQITGGIVTELIYFNGNFQLLSIGNTFGVGVGTFGAEVPLASASTTDLGSTPNHNVLVTGTTTINSFGSNAQLAAPIYIIRFAGVLTLTFGTSLFLPGNANIVTMAGDSAIAEYFGSGNWRILGYFPATGVQSNNKIKPGDTVQISNTTLTADPDLQSNTLAVGRYFWSVFLIFDSVAGGAGFKWTNDGTAVDSRAVAPALASGFVNSSAYTSRAESPYGNTITYAAVSTAPNSNEVLYTGSLLVSTPGTFGVSWAQASTTASNTTLRAGSYLTMTLANTGTSSGTTTRIYQTPGAGLETIPSGFNTLTIECWGGSGGGGGGFFSGGNTSGGGGASSGSYSRTVVSVTGLGGDTLNFTVGALGIPSNNAGASSVSSGTLAITTMTSPGGLGGGNATSLGNAGAGGAAPAIATGGTVSNIQGNAGSPGANNVGGGFGGQGGFGIPGITDGGNKGGIGAASGAGQSGGVGIVAFQYQ